MYNINIKGISLYYQIKEYIEGKIENGDWESGYQIPSETELAKFFNVSRPTVRQAISELVQSGKIIRKQGLGTFVAEPKLEANFIQFYFPEEFGTQHKLISVNKTNCSNSIAQTLDIKQNAQVYEIYRVRYFKKEPMVLEKSYLSTSVFPDFESQDLSNKLYDIVQEKYHIKLFNSKTIIEPIIINTCEAELLQVNPGSPALLLYRTVYSFEKKPMIFTKSIVRGDKCRLLVMY